MTLIELTVILGVFLGGVIGAVWGSGFGLAWAAVGLVGGIVLGPFALALLFVLLMCITEAPLALLRWVRPAPVAPVPGARRLLVVEDTFDIQGLGVLVAPDVDLGERVQMDVRVALRRPDGDVLQAVALAQMPLGSFRARRSQHMLCFRTLSKQDLPAGTEVWLLGEVAST